MNDINDSLPTYPKVIKLLLMTFSAIVLIILFT